MKTLLIIMTFAITAFSCASNENNSGNESNSQAVTTDNTGGKVATRRLANVEAFTAINMIGSIDVEFKQGKQRSITLTGVETLLNNVEVSYADGTCTLKLTNRNRIARGGVKASIVSPHLSDVVIIGSGDFEVRDAIYGKSLNLSIVGSGDWVARNIKYDDVKVEISGSGDVDLNGLSCKTVSVLVSGSGDVDISGKTNTGRFDLSGSGDIDAGKLTANIVEAATSGSGDIQVYAVKALNASTSGSGEIEYYGSPAKLQKAGKVHKM